MTNVTLVSAITIEGLHYYALIKGSNNQWTFARFMMMLNERLTKENPRWKRKCYILLDNATIHKTPHMNKVIMDNDIPVKFCAPGSFDAIPIESIFGSVKRRYTKIMAQKMERCQKNGTLGQRGKRQELMVESIEAAVATVDKE